MSRATRSVGWQLAVPAVLAIALLVVGRLTPMGAWAAELATRMRETGVVGGVVFAAVYVGATLAAMPVSFLTGAAGFAYGPLVATAIVLPVSVGAATLAFVLGRTLLRGRAERLLAGSPKMQALAGVAEHRGFPIVLCMRLAMIFPFGVLNFVLGATKLRVRDFFLASLVGCIPSTLFYTYVASLVPSAADVGHAGAYAPRWLVVAGVGVGAVAVFLLVRLALHEMRRLTPATR